MLPSERKQQRCSRCGEVGHNAITCKAGSSPRAAAKAIPVEEHRKTHPDFAAAHPEEHEIALTVRLNVVVSVQVEAQQPAAPDKKAAA